MKATIIIPSYNGKKFLKDCIEALYRQTFRDFEIILTDNGSTDGSAAYVRSHFPQVRILRSLKNRGFSSAVNAGIRRASSPYVVLLNNDTIAEPDFLLHLIASIEESENIFSVSSLMLNLYRPELTDSAGDLYTLPGYAVCRGMGRPSSCFNRARDVFSACAGAAVYRREALIRLGGFDERFFAYLEDVDLGYRARLNGYVNRYCPQAVVYHARGGTSGTGYTPFKVYYSARNNVWLNYKNMPGLQLLINAFPILLGCLLKYFYFCRIGLGGIYRMGVKSGIRALPFDRKKTFTPRQKRLAWRIEAELMKNTLSYAKDLLLRHIAGTQGVR